MYQFNHNIIPDVINKNYLSQTVVLTIAVNTRLSNNVSIELTQN